MLDYKYDSGDQPFINLIVKTITFSSLLVAFATIERSFSVAMNDAAGDTFSYQLPLIGLTFGLRMIVAFFEGYRSILYFLPGALFFDDMTLGLSLTHSEAIITQLAILSVAPAIYHLADWAFARHHLDMLNGPEGWRILFAGTLVVALIETLCVMLLNQGIFSNVALSLPMIAIFASKIAAVILLLATLLAIYRFSKGNG